MKMPKRIFPKNYFKHTVPLTPQIESLPFYIKEFGFCNDRKFTLGQKNSYSDFLFLYPVSGVMRFTKNSNTQYIQENNVIVSSCSSPLTFTRTSKDWEFIYLIVRGSHIKFYYNYIRNNSNVIPCTPLNKILDYFLEIIALSSEDDFYNSMQASLLVHNILIELYNISYNILKTKAITPVQETIVNQCLKYIANNYQNYLDIDTICAEVSFSKYYFCKIFKQHMGITIHQYLNEYRVNKSKELLTYSKLSISAIATSVGFENPLTYSRCFERSMHMTPSEYRRNF